MHSPAFFVCDWRRTHRSASWALVRLPSSAAVACPTRSRSGCDPGAPVSSDRPAQGHGHGRNQRRAAEALPLRQPYCVAFDLEGEKEKVISQLRSVAFDLEGEKEQVISQLYSVAFDLGGEEEQVISQLYVVTFDLGGEKEQVISQLYSVAFDLAERDRKSHKSTI